MVFYVHFQVANINKIPKPKPKIQKPTKNESESSGQNTDSNEKVDEQPKAHDELWFNWDSGNARRSFNHIYLHNLYS